MLFSTVRIAKLLFCLGSDRSPENAFDFFAIFFVPRERVTNPKHHREGVMIGQSGEVQFDALRDSAGQASMKSEVAAIPSGIAMIARDGEDGRCLECYTVNRSADG